MAETEKEVNISELKEKWCSVLTEEDMHVKNRSDLRKYMSLNTSIPSEILDELNTVCSTETLNCSDEPKDRDTLLSDAAKGTSLISVAHQSKDLEHRAKNLQYKYFLTDRQRYLTRKTPWLHDYLSRLGKKEFVKIDTPDIIITIEVFRPFLKGKRLILDLEFQVLGSQKLTELRDKINCLSDYVIPGEYSEKPDHLPSQRTKDMYKSGFFFIEDVFYNDMRDPNNQDNSSVIIDWAKKENVGNYTSRIMEETTFTDLSVKLGKAYVYEHQGNCQHLLVFSDVRLLHREDCQNRLQYPIITVKRITKRVICRICGMYAAKWTTRKCKIAPEDPCFYCDSCFQAFHYDSKGKKLFDFKAYHFNSESK